MCTKKVRLRCSDQFFARGITLRIVLLLQTIFNCCHATHKSTNDRRKSKSSTKYHTTGGLRRDQASKNVYYRFSDFVVIIIRQRKEYSRKCCNLSRRNLSRHCIRPTWHSKHFRKPAKKKIGRKNYLQTRSFFCMPSLGPLTPLQIFLSRRKNDVLVTWMKYLMLDCSYLGSICQAIGSKFDQNLNLNFPSLFSDWSIQKFLETNSKNF